MDKKISCTFIGHATVLVEMNETAILTDPHFGQRTLFFPRKVALTIAPSDIHPKAVLLSHTHFDHLNISSYKYISCSVPIIVPEGSERAIGQYLPNPIIELSHYAEHELTSGIKITAVPVLHRSGRISQFRFRKSNAYLITHPQGGGCVFFCGDSAYSPLFGEIGKLGSIDLALLPVGGYEPRFFLGRSHMTPAEAVRAFEDLKASHMVPIHHGTFRLSLEKLDEPVKWLNKIISSRHDLVGRVHVLKAGEKFSIY